MKTPSPKILKYMFEDKNVGAVTSRSFPDDMHEEITKILELAEKYPESKGFLSGEQLQGKC